MSGVALVLIAISVADLIAGGLTGEPRKGWPTVVALAVTTVTAALGAWWLGLEGTAAYLMTTLAVVGTAGWLWGKSVRAWRAALVMIALLLLLVAGLAGLWAGASPDGLEAWLDSLPFAAASDLDGGRFLLFAAVLLFLTGTANSVVRGVLTVARTEWQESEETLRGGRFIGVLERWMIFTLAVAGEPTAAALIVSAKSLLRFPELSNTAREPKEDVDGGTRVPDVDQVTEYFLLGSLLSWALALAPVALF